MMHWQPYLVIKNNKVQIAVAVSNYYLGEGSKKGAIEVSQLIHLCVRAQDFQSLIFPTV